MVSLAKVTKMHLKNGTSLGLYRITVCRGHTIISDQINTEKKTTDVPRQILKNM